MSSESFKAGHLDLPLRRLIRQREETEAEVESLCNMMYLMNKARLKYESSMEYINSQDYSYAEPRAIYHLTENTYAQGDIGRFKKGMNFGRDYQTDTDKENAINHFFTKIEKIKLKLSVAQRLLAAKILEREKLRKATAEKFLEERREELETQIGSGTRI